MSDQRDAHTGTLRNHIIENGVDVLVVDDLQVAASKRSTGRGRKRTLRP